MNFLHECDLLRRELEREPGASEQRYLGRKWFHGGAGVLSRGDLILPPGATGVPPNPAPTGPASLVYFSNEDRARFQALGCYGRQTPPGSLYEVEPDGRAWPDPAEGESWCAIRATVVRVVERSVSHWRGMSFDGVIEWAHRHGDFDERPSVQDGFSFTLRAHQCGLENALRMQRRDRRREGAEAA